MKYCSSNTVRDISGAALTGGYAGPMIQRGAGLTDPGTGDWGQIRIDDFSVSPAETLGEEGLYSFSDSFTRVANGGPYKDWEDVSTNTAIPGGVSWTRSQVFPGTGAAGCCTLIPNDAGVGTGGDGRVEINSGANGFGTLMYDDQTLLAGRAYELSLNVEAFPDNGVGGLAFHWNTLENVSNSVSAYVFQIHNNTNSQAQTPLHVRLIKFVDASEDPARPNRAPDPTDVLLDWTPLPGFSAISADGHAEGNTVKLSVRYGGGTRFLLAAEQGEQVWSRSVKDSGSLLTGGHAGAAARRGLGMSDAEANLNWSGFGFDDFMLAPAEPDPTGTQIIVR